MISDYFERVRRVESGGNDRAKNPRSSATGRYQFIDSTWQGLAQRYPELGLTDRFDPDQQERAMRVFTEENRRVLQGAGIPISGGTLYAAHFLGAGGASNVLRQPDQAPLTSLLPENVIAANPFLRDMNVGAFRQWAARHGGGDVPTFGTQVPAMPQGIMGYGPTAAASAPTDQPKGLMAALSDPGVQASIMGLVAPPQAPQIAPRQVEAYQPTRRDTLAPYIELMKKMGRRNA